MRRGGWAVHDGARARRLLRGVARPRSPNTPRATGAGARATCSTWACCPRAACIGRRGCILLTGIGSYVAAPLWLLFLFTGILISLQAQFIRPEYFPKTFTLYPQWPAQDPVRAAYVFAGTMVLLLLPKLSAISRCWPTARRAGGSAAASARFSACWPRS